MCRVKCAGDLNGFPALFLLSYYDSTLNKGFRNTQYFLDGITGTVNAS